MYELWMWVKEDNEELAVNGHKEPITVTNVAGPHGSHRFVMFNLMNFGCPDDTTLSRIEAIAGHPKYLCSSLELKSGQMLPNLPRRAVKEGMVWLHGKAMSGTIWGAVPGQLLCEGPSIEAGIFEGWEDSLILERGSEGRIYAKTYSLTPFLPANQHGWRWHAALLMYGGAASLILLRLLGG